MVTEEGARIMLDAIQTFILKGDVNEEYAVNAVKLLRQLMTENDLHLAFKNEMLPKELKPVMAFIESRKYLLSKPQVQLYDSVRDFLRQKGFLSARQHSVLISMYAYLNNAYLE